MSKPSIILIGAGGHAHACIDVIEEQGQYQVAGLIGMKDEVNSQYHGYPVMSTDGGLLELAKTYQYIFIAIGQIISPDKRIQLYHLMLMCLTMPILERELS